MNCSWKKGKPALAGIATVVLSVACVQGLVAQDQKPDVMQSAFEFIRVSNAEGEVNLVFWIPDEFFKLSMASNPNVSQSAMDTVINVVHPYTIMGVASGKTRPFAAMEYRTEAELRDLVRLKDSKGNVYSPLPEDQVNPSLKGLLAILKPGMSRMAGATGENMYFFAFSGSTQDGARVCDPTKEGTCEVDLGTRQFKWRLPLGSLLPKQKCPTCGEMLSGAYKYCPYDGTKLEGSK